MDLRIKTDMQRVLHAHIPLLLKQLEKLGCITEQHFEFQKSKCVQQESWYITEVKHVWIGYDPQKDVSALLKLGIDWPDAYFTVEELTPNASDIEAGCVVATCAMPDAVVQPSLDHRDAV